LSDPLAPTDEAAVAAAVVAAAQAKEPLAIGGNGTKLGMLRPVQAARSLSVRNLTGITLYSLRHSSIVRALLANVPARVVAALHDTSLQMLEATYSAFISEFGDSIARKSLLEIAPPKAGKVVPLGRRS